jgi:hypothetical protein
MTARDNLAREFFLSDAEREDRDYWQSIWDSWDPAAREAACAEEYGSADIAKAYGDRRVAEAVAQKPFSTYPEDRAQMLALCSEVATCWDGEELRDAAIKLADLVSAILDDEASALSPAREGGIGDE